LAAQGLGVKVIPTEVLAILHREVEPALPLQAQGRLRLETALADAAGEGADVALSMNVVVWNSAIAAGALTGGILLDQFGVNVFPWVLLVLLLVGLGIVFSARAHGFPQGHRQAGAAVVGH
jgi:predicted MFS family arabinose efflux permease